jgi:hypothetical protein
VDSSLYEPHLTSLVNDSKSLTLGAGKVTEALFRSGYSREEMDVLGCRAMPNLYAKINLSIVW